MNIEETIAKIKKETAANRQKFSASNLKPNYEAIHPWEYYPSFLETEYQECIEEGLEIEAYKDLFDAVYHLPKDEMQKKLGDILFEIVTNAKEKENYPYTEPSDLESIKALRKKHCLPDSKLSKAELEEKIHGAWMGRICGCMLGKTVEGMRTNELIPFLTESGNYPMHRYIYKTDINDAVCEKYQFPLANRPYADEIDGMPVDDDTNYTVLYQLIVEQYGRDFTPKDVAKAWLAMQPKDAYCTAERVAFCNFVNGFEPPYSAYYKNPYREWIGAQIRGDYFGYINPGNPELAAEMAWRDASISHTKNGIYGEMFASAMIAAAAVTDEIEAILLAGLGEIPCTSRLYAEIMSVLNGYKKGISQKECFDNIHQKYDEYTPHGWCHTIPNAMIVAAALLYGEKDFGKSLCMAVDVGFDTDCNGATVGSVLGMALGIDNIPDYWKNPLQDTLHTSIFGVGTVKISDCAKKAMKHMR